MGLEAKQTWPRTLRTCSIGSVQNDQLPEQVDTQGTQWVISRDVQSLP